MQQVLKDKEYSVEDYLTLEESGEVRHEFVNETLYEMSGASREHHFICKKLLFFFELALKGKGYFTFIENMKVKIPNEKTFYYPDILVSDEAQTKENRYMQFSPVLLAEVTSDSTRKTDMVDKLIQYQKFNSLKYYLIVEQDKKEIIVISKNPGNNWQTETFNHTNTTISLPLLGINFSLSDVYGE